jgi:probable addiction module antidote protein
MAKATKGINFDDHLDEYLADSENAAIYLTVALEEDDAYFLEQALSRIVRLHGASKVASKTGIARQALYKMLSEGGNPSYKNVCKILDALGLENVIQKKKQKKKKSS